MIEKIREGLYVKKTRSGKWIQVFPIKNDNGTINWRNLIIGRSWIDLLFVALLLFSLWAYAHDTKECRELIENPPRCEIITANQGGWDVALPNITFSKVENEFNTPVPS